MLEELTSKQISEWAAYDELEPIGRDRIEFGLAMICATITNIARGIWGTGNAKPLTPYDFLPQWGGGPRGGEKESAQSPEEMKEILMSLARQGKKKEVAK